MLTTMPCWRVHLHFLRRSWTILTCLRPRAPTPGDYEETHKPDMSRRHSDDCALGYAGEPLASKLDNSEPLCCSDTPKLMETVKMEKSECRWTSLWLQSGWVHYSLWWFVRWPDALQFVASKTCYIGEMYHLSSRRGAVLPTGKVAASM